jgi:dimethylargininase
MLTALTRKVSPALGHCALEFQTRQEINIAIATRQHEQYEACLAGLGLRVISLPAEPALPDSMFVEDPAVVVDEVAVIARMGNVARRTESDSIAQALSTFRPLRPMRDPATLEGGDVLRAGRTFFVGLSNRTNQHGIAQLAAELAPYGYSVIPVEVRRCLHLKSGACYLGDGTILANRAWIDPTPLREFRIIDVAPNEPGAANALAVGGAVIMPAAFPATADTLRRAGYNVLTLDISELMKAEAGNNASASPIVRREIIFASASTNCI